MERSRVWKRHRSDGEGSALNPGALTWCERLRMVPPGLGMFSSH